VTQAAAVARPASREVTLNSYSTCMIPTLFPEPAEQLVIGLSVTKTQ